MRFLINALSVTNASGRHVLLGHLAGLAGRTLGRHEYIVLWHAGNREIVRNLGSNVTWRCCPAVCRHWLGRAIWERVQLIRVCRQEHVGAVFTPAGAAMPVAKLPQIVFCQNPWALVAGLPRSGGDHVKGFLQRMGYRRAVRRADVMVFISRFMEEAYEINSGCRPVARVIAYPGIDEETFEAAGRSWGARVPLQILSVSAMAPHKDVETLLRSVAFLRDRLGVEAQLKLVGAWPDGRYRESMAALAERLGLSKAVEFCGHVTRDELHRFYAVSSVFALFSRCESFGIPAVEAQVFGTPVVGADCCATREVEGEGGVYVPPGDYEAAAVALHRLLTNTDYYREMSVRAKANAERFRWEACTGALLSAFEKIAEA